MIIGSSLVRMLRGGGLGKIEWNDLQGNLPKAILLINKLF